MGRFIRRHNQNGDTLIEVLISIAIIGVALGTGYALTNRSYHTGVGAGERSVAVALAQGQVDFIKDAYLSSSNPVKSSMLSSYKGAPTGFCISSTGSGAGTVLGQTGCRNYAGSINDISITYVADPPPATGGTFTVTSKWDSSNSNSKNQTTLFYKVSK